MKETNMEHYRSEIEKVDYKFAMQEGKVVACGRVLKCSDCDFTDPCVKNRIEWLMSEYKPEPVLTQREKGFLECVGSGWISRDKDGTVGWSRDKVKKIKADDCWVNGYGRGFATLKEDTFPFITWEDEEPWAVEELRKLKVADE